ncbi:MAG: hypothetical protein ABI990_01615 [Actinomycetota bacterium]
MTLTKKKKFADEQLVVCLESYAGNLDDMTGRCARGTRLLGSNPIVQARPHFFADATLPDDELDKLRRELWPEAVFPQ